MSKPIMVAFASVAFALAACSKAEQQDTTHDVKAAAQDVGQKAKEAANSPEVKKVGSEIKQAAGDAGTVLKHAAKGAAQGAKEGAAEVRGNNASTTEPDPNAPKKN